MVLRLADIRRPLRSPQTSESRHGLPDSNRLIPAKGVSAKPVTNFPIRLCPWRHPKDKPPKTVAGKPASGGADQVRRKGLIGLVMVVVAAGDGRMTCRTPVPGRKTCGSDSI
nr:hypothetical protein GCM10020093_027700 [Planobispora longispora]